MICECKAAIADTAKFCPKCGKSVVESTEPIGPTEPSGGAKKCPQCGAENPATAKFCKRDGAPLNAPFSDRPAGAALPTPRTRKSISLALVGGAVALLVAAIAVGFFYLSGNSVQSSPTRAIDARPAEKGPSEKGFAESNQTIKGLAQQPVPENRPQWESQPSPPPQPNIAATAAPGLQEPHSQPERQPSSQARPQLDSSQPIPELRPQSEPQPTSEAPSELAGLPPQPVAESSAASEPQPSLEAQAKLSTAAAQPFSEPLQPATEPLAAQPTPEAPLPSVESVPESSPPAASVSAEPKAPTAAKKPAAPKIAAIQNQLNTALRQRGFSNVRAKVIDKQTVALSGTVKSAEEKASASELVSNASGMKNIRNEVKVAAADPALFDFPKPGTAPNLEGQNIEQVAIAKPATASDPAKVEGEINRALREGGVSGVTAQIGDDFSATLKGAARSPGEKEKAFQIARQFHGVRDIKDQVFVVEE